jgi:hypothetical protein
VDLEGTTLNAKVEDVIRGVWRDEQKEVIVYLSDYGPHVRQHELASYYESNPWYFYMRILEGTSIPLSKMKPRRFDMILPSKSFLSLYIGKWNMWIGDIENEVMEVQGDLWIFETYETTLTFLWKIE